MLGAGDTVYLQKAGDAWEFAVHCVFGVFRKHGRLPPDCPPHRMPYRARTEAVEALTEFG